MGRLNGVFHHLERKHYEQGERAGKLLAANLNLQGVQISKIYNSVE